MVHDKTTFGRGLADEVVRTLKAAGEAEAAFEGFDRGERDLSRLVGRLARARVEVVYLGGLAADAVTLVRALRGAGLTAPLVGSNGLIDRDFVAEAEGTVMTAPPEPRRLPEIKASEVRNPAGRLLRTPEAETVVGQTYAAVEVLVRAIDGAKSTEPRTVAAFLHTGQPVKTLIGDLAYDTQGDLLRSGYALYAWRRTGDGRIDYLGHQINP
ncbi:ABC transporter substrate-binding protein [uncultured Methylobacterium sp.]|uniref:ABC transporter substrate-binding protein n=1 Tax=uncultured Methylobacterium sp. TaxID=157278 RepID=UPI0035CBAFB9